MSEEFLSPTAFAQKIDISCVQAFHTREEIDRMIAAAIHYHFAAVFTLPSFTSYVSEKLSGFPDIHTGGVVSFPSGGDTSIQKKRQADDLLSIGCQELDMVMNLTAFKSREYSYVLQDILSVRTLSDSFLLKVIIETPQFSESEIRQAVDLCVEGGADYVKTSTGWYPAYPTTLKQVQILSDQAAGRILVKAAGGIRTLETIQAMEQAGCSRFGLGLHSALSLFKDTF